MRTMNGVLVVDAVVLVVDANLVCTGTMESAHALAEGGVGSGRHVELWFDVAGAGEADEMPIFYSLL